MSCYNYLEDDGKPCIYNTVVNILSIILGIQAPRNPARSCRSCFVRHYLEDDGNTVLLAEIVGLLRAVDLVVCAGDDRQPCRDGRLPCLHLINGEYN